MKNTLYENNKKSWHAIHEITESKGNVTFDIFLHQCRIQDESIKFSINHNEMKKLIEVLIDLQRTEQEIKTNIFNYPSKKRILFTE